MAEQGTQAENCSRNIDPRSGSAVREMRFLTRIYEGKMAASYEWSCGIFVAVDSQ
jgi:hypothetical protein